MFNGKRFGMTQNKDITQEILFKLGQITASVEEYHRDVMLRVKTSVPQENSDVEFDVAKGKKYLVAMMVWLMVEMEWITVKDSKSKEKINVEHASQWFHHKLFGKPIKKWDQVLQYIFRWRPEENKKKFLKTFDTMKNLVERRLKKD